MVACRVTAAAVQRSVHAQSLQCTRNVRSGRHLADFCLLVCCCCICFLQGMTKVRANATGSGLLDVDTTLAGTGFACLQKDGPVHMTFTLLNRTAAESKPFDNVNAKFMATMATNDTELVVVSNSIVRACSHTRTPSALRFLSAACSLNSCHPAFSLSLSVYLCVASSVPDVPAKGRCAFGCQHTNCVIRSAHRTRARRTSHATINRGGHSFFPPSSFSPASLLYIPAASFSLPLLLLLFPPSFLLSRRCTYLCLLRSFLSLRSFAIAQLSRRTISFHSSTFCLLLPPPNRVK